MATASLAAGRQILGGVVRAVRPDERPLVLAAGAVFALASAGAAMSAAAADAMFLAELGPAHLGGAVAASSALLAVVLALVGGLADRLERRRILASVATLGGAAALALAATAVAWPRATAIVALIGGKQLAAATDLVFWVVLAERLDARRSQRLVPVLAAAGGGGAALGALLVVPLAAAGGTRAVLVVAAGALLAAGALTARLPATRWVVARGAGAISGLVTRAWRDGARAVRRHPLAAELAVVVGLAGVFASLLYFALGVAVTAEHADAASLAALLGGVRAIGQVVTLAFQLLIAPRLLLRIGTGRALLVAPIAALVAAIALFVAPILALAIAAQISARVLDAAIETPAEKLAQTLLPPAVRGRIAGFLDGTAKRVGAIAGGLAAAALTGAPAWFYATLAAVAAAWAIASGRLSGRLPALAVAQASRDEVDLVVDDRARALLVGELAGPRPARAADVLARLHGRGRLDAVVALTTAALARDDAGVWRALGAALVSGAGGASSVPGGGAPLLAAVSRCGPTTRPLALRAIGLAGGAPAAALAAWRDDDDPLVAFAAEVAALRLGPAEDGALLAALGDGARDPALVDPALEELALELSRARVAGRVDDALATTRVLARVVRHGRGTCASRIEGLGQLAVVVGWGREVDAGRAGGAGGAGAPAELARRAELALLRAELLEIARERAALDDVDGALGGGPVGGAGQASEAAAAIGLWGALLDGAPTAPTDDVRALSGALGAADDEVRAAAGRALAGLGGAAAGELIAVAAFGRRAARDVAAGLLAALPVTPGALAQLIEAELHALDRTSVALAVVGGTGGDALLARRLDERLREIAHTVLLLVAARQRSPAIAAAATAWRQARGRVERARALAVIDAGLPRALVGRLVEVVDDVAPAERAAALAARGEPPPGRDAVIRAELSGGDRLARAIVLHTLGAAGRNAHRAAIAGAALAEAEARGPLALLRRLAGVVPAVATPQPLTLDAPTAPTATDEESPEMPTRVETLITLGKVPLFAALTTRQLADVAARARWLHLAAGEVVVAAGEPLDALLVVDDGELVVGERRLGRGDVVDELAPVAPALAAAEVRARGPARIVRLERAAFEELIDDVPGLAAAVCRALGERLRSREPGAGRSPLVTLR